MLAEFLEKSSYFLFLLLLVASLPRSSGLMHRGKASITMARVCVQPCSQPQQCTFPQEFKGCATFFMVFKISGKSPSCLSCTPEASPWELQWGKFLDYLSTSLKASLLLPRDSWQEVAGGLRRWYQIFSSTISW